MTIPPVCITDLSKNFRTLKALKHISFTLEPGETVALLGRNGAGKSTLIGCLMGFLIPDRGTIELFGENIQTLPGNLRARTGFVPQTMSGFASFSVSHLLNYIAAFYGALPPIDPHLLEWADLNPKAIVKSLSGGQKQRLAILLAMRHSPDFLVLDEPVASLDPHARREFMTLLAEYARRIGATILISSHILSDIERLCSRLLFLHNGELILDTPTTTFHNTTRWLDHPDPTALTSLPLRILGQRNTGLLVNGWTETLPLPEGTTVSPPDFEDAFLEITRTPAA